MTTAPVEDIAALVADSLAMVKTAEARVYDRNFIVDKLIAYVRRLATALSQAEGRGPTKGNWINADDVDALVRRLDVALNGEEGAAKQARLCDIVSQVEHEAEGRGGAKDRADDRREELKNAFVAGCIEMLNWMHSSAPQDDLDEAGYDYAAYVASSPPPPSPPEGER